MRRRRDKPAIRPSPPSQQAGASLASVRLTDPAVEDLERLRRKNPQALKWALSKLLLLEKNPYAGEPLVGPLVGWRKLTVGDRQWRVVWRVDRQASGTVVVDVAEVWAVGARSDDEVYQEMKSRIAKMPRGAGAQALSEVVERLGSIGQSSASPPVVPVGNQPPSWLVERLVQQARLPREQVASMTEEQAVDAWTEWRVSGR